MDCGTLEDRYPLAKPGRGVLTETDYTGEMILAPYDGELLLAKEG